MRSCGIDIGARTVKCVILEGGRVAGTIVADGGPDPQQVAEDAFGFALRAAGQKSMDRARIFATGYGREHFRAAGATVSEISCHAAGVSRLIPGARALVDIGGQDSKAILLGEGGRVANFAMNDRCAAGTGRFIEMVAQLLGVPLDEVGPLSLGASASSEINSMCAVFAESEIVGLLHQGAPKEAILRGVFRSVARRTLSLLGGLGIAGDIVFTGGVARNPGVVRALEEEGRLRVRVPENPQITGALGAAILAQRSA
jgi:predicted CoA-substrate-specific enzyme activase